MIARNFLFMGYIYRNAMEVNGYISSFWLKEGQTNPLYCKRQNIPVSLLRFKSFDVLS